MPTVKLNPPYRADQVGTFLRPAELLEARSKFESGKIPIAELRQVEDKYIIDLVEKQKKNGLRSITDGDFRRGHWFLDFMLGLDGVSVEYGNTSRGLTAFLQVVGKVKHKGSITVPSYLFLKDKLGIPEAKVCIPSPTLLHFGGTPETTPKISKTAYPDADEIGSAFFTDLAACYRAELKALYDAGCRYVQLDETCLALMCDPKWQAAVENRGYKFDELLQQYVKLINDAIDIPERAEMTISMHSCRGNFKAMWFAQGGYGAVAQALFSEIKIDCHFLEFDTERAGTFEPLEHLAPNKSVCLGLITTKTPELENREEVIARIMEAAKIVPLERLHLSGQCGFASTHHGNPLTEEAQWAKVRLTTEIAKEVWPDA